MPSNREGLRGGKEAFVRYPKLTYSTIQRGLMRVLVQRKVGRNALMVMIELCRSTYADGRFGRVSALDISEDTCLTLNQVARGMTELREKKIITPVIRTTKEGYRHPDRSNFGHVAQYCFTKEVWALIEKEETGSESIREPGKA